MARGGSYSKRSEYIKLVEGPAVLRILKPPDFLGLLTLWEAVAAAVDLRV
jgi:hypothetical protein